MTFRADEQVVLPMIHTRETDGSRGIPFMGVGAYPTVDDAAKIAQLFQDGGHYEGQQLLHQAKSEAALYRSGLTGSPTGKSFAYGDQAYNLIFWRINHRTVGGHFFPGAFPVGVGVTQFF